ncbi:MAG: sigma-54-dependent Fis family transcriptional regulator [Deltaproteobacteria bacterium]|nr:sigma-54-dependent Fis family transcriptional regulator [Deltaproteobacteria bacterium]
MDKVLIIDDEAGLRLMLRAVLEDVGYRVDDASDGEKGLASFEAGEYGVVLLDMRMPGMDGMEVLRRILHSAPNQPVVMLTAFGTVGSAVEAMKSGAFDYLTKPADNEELKAVVAKACEHGRLRRENADLRKRLGGGRAIIGQSRTMARVLDLLDQAGPTEVTVLVTGESGTGKELVAEALHSRSARKNMPLIKVNCAALPSDLLESELFGYRKGAFTGAVQDKPGRFQLASGGTLFLDEIGEMPVALQAKILRALQERVVEPLGSVRAEEVDVRLVAATNRDLQTEVAAGRFREDLYYRLNVLEIHMPPLKDRQGDIPLLVEFLIRKLGEKNRKSIRSASPAFLEALERYSWPGNVRELENTLERAIILSRADVLEPRDLPAHVFEPRTSESSADPDLSPGSTVQSETPLDRAEREALVRTLAKHGGHREQTARALGISRRTLQYKIRKFGLKTRRG